MIKKLVAKEVDESNTVMVDPETGKQYRPVDGWDVAAVGDTDLASMFIEIPAAPPGDTGDEISLPVSVKITENSMILNGKEIADIVARFELSWDPDRPYSTLRIDIPVSGIDVALDALVEVRVEDE